MNLLSFSERWLNSLAPPETPKSPQIQVDGGHDTEDAEDDGLHAADYISPSAQERLKRRGQTKPLHVQNSKMAQRSIATPRSDRERSLLRPRAGDTTFRGLSGIPISTYSTRINGGVKPRNDFSQSTGASMRRSARQDLVAIDADAHTDKKMRIQKAGDGFEREAVIHSQHKSLPASTAKSTVSKPSTRGKIWHLGSFASGTAQAAATYDNETMATREVEEIGSAKARSPPSKLAVQRAKRPRQSSERSSPDELSRGPPGDYDSVRVITGNRPSRRPSTRPRQSPQKRQSPHEEDLGFGLKSIFYGKKVYKDHDLFINPQKGRTVYNWWYNGQDQGVCFRTKSILNMCFHGDSPWILLQISENSSSVPSTIVLIFNSMKDHAACARSLIVDKAEATQDFTAQMTNVEFEDYVTRRMDQGPKNGRAFSVSSSEAMSLRDVNPQLQPSSRLKLKDRMTGAKGDVQGYEEGSIDRIIKKTREPTSDSNFSKRRSGRLRNSPNVDKTISYLDKDPSPPIAPVVPDNQRYSKTQGLGNEWKHPLIYPSQGKNRATVYWHDLEKLDEGELLNDNLINFQLRFLENSLKERSRETASQVYWFNTYFFTTLVSGRKSAKGINYDAVKKWTRNVDIFGYDYIVVPIVENLHWYVAVICNAPAITRETPDFMEGLEIGVGERDIADKNFSDAHKAPSLMSEYPESPAAKDAEPQAPEDVSDSSENSLVGKRTLGPVGLHASPPVDSIFDELDKIEAKRSNGFSSDSADRSPAGDDSYGTNNGKKVLATLEQAVKNDKEPSQVSIEEVDEAGHDVSKDEDIHLISETSDGISIAQPSKKFPTRRKSRPNAPIRRYDPQTPAIVTLDSLGVSHGNTISKLKTYLAEEAKDKRGGMDIDKREIQGLTGTGIPEQTNFVDCGLYLLGYVAKFVQGPKDFANNLLQKTFDKDKDWPLLDASAMRNELRDIIFKQHSDQEGLRKAEKDIRKRKAAGKRSDTLSHLGPVATNSEGLPDPHESDALVDSATRVSVQEIEKEAHDGGQSTAGETSQIASKDGVIFKDTKRVHDQDAIFPGVQEGQVAVVDRTLSGAGRRRTENAFIGQWTADGDWRMVDGTPPQTHGISVTVPQHQSRREMVEVPETPQPSPPFTVRDQSPRDRSASPKRPKSQGKVVSSYFGTSKVEKPRRRGKGIVRKPSPEVIDLDSE